MASPSSLRKIFFTSFTSKIINSHHQNLITSYFKILQPSRSSNSSHFNCTCLESSPLQSESFEHRITSQPSSLSTSCQIYFSKHQSRVVHILGQGSFYRNRLKFHNHEKERFSSSNTRDSKDQVFFSFLSKLAQTDSTKPSFPIIYLFFNASFKPILSFKALFPSLSFLIATSSTRFKPFSLDNRLNPK